MAKPDESSASQYTGFGTQTSKLSKLEKRIDDSELLFIDIEFLSMLDQVDPWYQPKTRRSTYEALRN